MTNKQTVKYRNLRVALLRRGLTLTSWARQNGYPASTVHSAARGLRAGVKAFKIMNHLEEVQNG